MDLIDSVLNFVVPPASLVMLAFSWPALFFLGACERFFSSFFSEDMEDRVVIVTGASSGIGEQIAYEYAKRRANLVLVARREHRLLVISENARRMGAKHVMIIAADVVKEAECRRFVNDTMNFHGRLDHLVNAASLGHTFYFEEAADTSVFPILMDINFWGNVYPAYVALPYLRQYHGRVIVNASVDWLPLPRMSLYAVSKRESCLVLLFDVQLEDILPFCTLLLMNNAAKAALINFYETLRFEVKDEVGVTVATHGWVGTELSSGKFMVEEGAEMQWKEEREAHAAGGAVEEYARLIVAGACRGDAYVKYPSWHDVFMLYRAFAPSVLSWTLHLLLADHGARATSPIGTGRPLPKGAAPPRKLLAAPQQ